MTPQHPPRPPQEHADRPAGGETGPRGFPGLRGPSDDHHLSTVSELAQAGGNRGALAVIVYLIVGTSFWGLIGFLLDNLMGTRWIVFAGAGLGFAGGVALAFLRMQTGLPLDDERRPAAEAARHRSPRRPSDQPGRGPRGGSRKDRQ